MHGDTPSEQGSPRNPAHLEMEKGQDLHEGVAGAAQVWAPSGLRHKLPSQKGKLRLRRRP